MSPVLLFFKGNGGGVDLGERKVGEGNGKSDGMENCSQDEIH